MAGVATITYRFVSTNAIEAGEVLRPFERDGFPGMAWRAVGRRSDRFVVRAFNDYLAPSNAATAAVSAAALQGTIVNFITDDGNSFVNFVVERVTPEKPIAVRQSIGGLLPNGTAKVWRAFNFEGRFIP